MPDEPAGHTECGEGRGHHEERDSVVLGGQRFELGPALAEEHFGGGEERVSETGAEGGEGQEDRQRHAPHPGGDRDQAADGADEASGERQAGPVAIEGG